MGMDGLQSQGQGYTPPKLEWTLHLEANSPSIEHVKYSQEFQCQYGNTPN